MGTFSIWHWLIVLAVVLILFGGGGKISKLMGDFGKGLKSFKKGMQEEEGKDDGKDAGPDDKKAAKPIEQADGGSATADRPDSAAEAAAPAEKRAEE